MRRTPAGIDRLIEKYDYKTARGWLRAEEREFLSFLSAGHVGTKGLIVNIGTEHGASLVCFRMGNMSCRIIGIDLDNSLAPQDLGIEFYDGDSSKIVDRIANVLSQPIDLLFIDGDHTYEGALADTAYTSFVKSGGIVVFHDCYDFGEPYVDGKPVIHKLVPGVDRAVTEWYESGNCWQEQGPVGTMRVFRKVGC